MNTFGWGRAEVLGALINAVFLLALCVIIILETIQKFIQPEPVEKPLTVCIGKGWNPMSQVHFHAFQLKILSELKF